MYWPNRIKAHGEVRSQWHHVIDVAPTILEAAKLPEPKIVNGTPQEPIQGVSMLYAVDDPKAVDRHTTQHLAFQVWADVSYHFHIRVTWRLGESRDGFDHCGIAFDVEDRLLELGAHGVD